MPNNLVRIVDRDPDALQVSSHCRQAEGARRSVCCARLRPTIAVNAITEAIEVDVTVLAESRKLTGQHDALLRGYAGLVRHIAYHLFRRRNYVDINDLIHAGMLGLREAIPGHGQNTAEFFEAYASVRIRGAMLDFVRQSDCSLRAGRRRLRNRPSLNVETYRRSIRAR